MVQTTGLEVVAMVSQTLLAFHLTHAGSSTLPAPPQWPLQVQGIVTGMGQAALRELEASALWVPACHGNCLIQ